MPRYEIHRHAGTVDYASWKELGIALPVFDKDGTLTHANRDEFVTEVIEGLRGNLVGVYPTIAIASNNPDPEQVKATCSSLQAQLGVEVFGICAGEGNRRKPDPLMGRKIAAYFGLRPDQLGIVGDRRLTDVTFGRKLGAGAIALCHKAGDGDARGVQTLRRFEAGLVGVERLLQVAA